MGERSEPTEPLTIIAIDGPAGSDVANPEGSHTVPMTNRNIATGNARVGVQAGQFYGNVTLGADAERPIDLAASIADLRTHLKQAHLDGQLDEETYAAAESELEAATACASAGTPEKKGGLMVALKRLRGLVADVSELAARLATIIAVVRGMS